MHSLERGRATADTVYGMACLANAHAAIRARGFAVALVRARPAPWPTRCADVAGIVKARAATRKSGLTHSARSPRDKGGRTQQSDTATAAGTLNMLG